MDDLISRAEVIELKPEFLNPNVNRETKEQTAIDRAYARGWNSCNTHWIKEIIEDLPSAQPETTRILAEALNGSPLLYPCDKLWSREGWCKDHCKKGQTEPDTECWLKYAETIAAERREE